MSKVVSDKAAAEDVEQQTTELCDEQKKEKRRKLLSETEKMKSKLGKHLKEIEYELKSVIGKREKLESELNEIDEKMKELQEKRSKLMLMKEKSDSKWAALKAENELIEEARRELCDAFSRLVSSPLVVHKQDTP